MVHNRGLQEQLAPGICYNVIDINKAQSFPTSDLSPFSNKGFFINFSQRNYFSFSKLADHQPDKLDVKDHVVLNVGEYEETYTRVTWKIFRVKCSFTFKTFHRRLFWNQEEALLL